MRSSPGQVAARLARIVDTTLEGAGLTVAQYRLLGLLGDGSQAASALAERLAVSRPSVTAVVDGLVARGWVRRSACADDRRRVEHHVTEAGAAKLAEAEASLTERLTAIAGVAGAPQVLLDGLLAWEPHLDAYRGARLLAAPPDGCPHPGPEPDCPTGAAAATPLPSEALTS